VRAEFNDPGAFKTPFVVRLTAELMPDTEIIEAVCDPSNTGVQHWTGAQSDELKKGVTVPRDVLARYVGVYEGVWAQRPRIADFRLAEEGLTVNVGGRTARLTARSETGFSSDAVAYEFVVENGVVVRVIESHVSGDYPLAKKK
jgi:hypothetical protein